MEALLSVIIFAIAIFLLSIGIIFKRDLPPAGCCSSDIEVNGENLTCGACPSKDAEICEEGDKDGYATLAQLGNPSRKGKYNGQSFPLN